MMLVQRLHAQRASRTQLEYLESQIGIAVHPSRRPLRGLLRMRSNLLKHNNLMLRSERRERLEAWQQATLQVLIVSTRSINRRTGQVKSCLLTGSWNCI